MNSVEFLQRVKLDGSSKSTERAFYVVVVLLVYCIRSAPFLLNAQFWAEDGVVYFQDAWNDGLSTVLKPYAGYYCSISRIIALIGAQFPVEQGPLVFALITFVLQALPLCLIFSDRTSAIFSKESLRFAFAFIYVAAPGQFETFNTATNLQWYLPVWILLLIFAEKPRHIGVQIAEYVYLAISCLSGPYIVFILPLYVVLLLFRKVKLLWAVAAILVVSFVLQLWSLQRHGSSSYLDAVKTLDWGRFADYFSSKVVLNSWFSTNRPELIINAWVNDLFTYAGLAVWLFVTVRVLIDGNYFIKALVFIGNMNFISGYLKVGHLMNADPTIGARYAMLAIIAYLYAYGYFVVTSKYRIEKVALGLLLLGCVLVGFQRDFNFFTPRGENWREHVREYQWANEGDIVDVKTNPPFFIAHIRKKGPTTALSSLEHNAYIDLFEVVSDTLRVRGWAILNGISSDEVGKEIILKSAVDSIALTPAPQLRGDVSVAYGGPYDSCGFQFEVPMSTLKPGDYSMTLKLSTRKYVREIDLGKKVTR